MKWMRLIPVLIVMLFVGACADTTAPTVNAAQQQQVDALMGGFDDLGYNDGARLFVGEVDGVDGTLDGTYYGDPTYARDHLVMKWNREWDRGNSEGWTNPPYAAWINNEWNGQVPGGSGETWHYMIRWVGPCSGTLPDGGVCIWGQFSVTMSQGTVDNQHFWQVHANPTGYGAR
jgi:hypothetical protein